MTVRAETEITLVRADDGAAGANGATFTPSVDVDGDISWTNDGGLPNPATQNIMGPAGAAGISVTGVQTQYYLSTSDSSATGGSWSNTQQEFESGKFYWTRDKITYSNGNTDYSTAVYAQGLTLANEYALDAKEEAENAQSYAQDAYSSSSTAIKQLSIVEDIVGVLEMVSKNGVYEQTPDMSPQEGKWYFVRKGNGTTIPYYYEIAPNVYDYVLTDDVTVQDDKTYYTRGGTAPDYVYTKVEPDGTENPHNLGWYEMESPHSKGYYELTDVTAAIQNYVSSHLVLTDQGINLQQGKTRLLLSSTDGMILYDATGTQTAKYGSTAVIGREDTYHIDISPLSGMQFKEGNVVTASITGNVLTIGNANISKAMKMGNFMWGIIPDGRLILKYLGV